MSASIRSFCANYTRKGRPEQKWNRIPSIDFGSHTEKHISSQAGGRFQDAHSQSVLKMACCSRSPLDARSNRSSLERTDIGVIDATSDFTQTLEKCDNLYKTIPVSNILQFYPHVLERTRVKDRSSLHSTPSKRCTDQSMIVEQISRIMQNRSIRADVAQMYRNLSSQQISNPIPTGSLSSLVYNSDQNLNQVNNNPSRSFHTVSILNVPIRTDPQNPVVSGPVEVTMISTSASPQHLNERGRPLSLDDVVRGARKALAKSLADDYMSRNPKKEPTKGKKSKKTSTSANGNSWEDELTALEEELIMLELHGQPAKNEFNISIDSHPSIADRRSATAVRQPTESDVGSSFHDVEKIRQRAAEIRDISPTTKIDIPQRSSDMEEPIDRQEGTSFAKGRRNSNSRRFRTGTSGVTIVTPDIPQSSMSIVNGVPPVGRRKFSSSPILPTNAPAVTASKRAVPVWRRPFRTPMYSPQVDRLITGGVAQERGDGTDRASNLGQSMMDSGNSLAEIAAGTPVIHEIAGPLLKEKMSTDRHASPKYWEEIFAKHSQKQIPESSMKSGRLGSDKNLSNGDADLSNSSAQNVPAPKMEDVRGPLLDEKVVNE